MILELLDLPQDKDAWASWAFSHAAAHRDIIRVVFETRGVSITEYPLDPISPPGLGNTLDLWLGQHQAMHQQQNAVMGIEGHDLLQLDPTDPESITAWINDHFVEHEQIARLLNLG